MRQVYSSRYILRLLIRSNLAYKETFIIKAKLLSCKLVYKVGNYMLIFIAIFCRLYCDLFNLLCVLILDNVSNVDRRKLEKIKLKLEIQFESDAPQLQSS